MNARENFGMSDILEIQVHRNGKLIAERITAPKGSLLISLAKMLGVKWVAEKLGMWKYGEDDIVNDGIEDIVSMISSAYGYVGIGTSDVAVDVEADHGLGTQVETRVAVAAEDKTITSTVEGINDTANFTGRFTLTADRAITECGLFKLATAGVMLCRQTFPVLNLKSGDQITFTWKIQVARPA